ncbi:O-Antigen ligase [Halolactibacillus halophilus]|uniref:O-Antigen ligase n=1 Tax=Halolactibacillus halophilus TaxID=306540 RepID=A0A1I5RYX1_9BACI|nr:O-antigen ligase family protein [Halolactibacillus halophilus]GEM02392.1 hypothetical protein HHA03_19240 [Halolactibacillus halophilus]SFP63617.1 O-Antigen ligase [Halolactibacillus halophilus]
MRGIYFFLLTAILLGGLVQQGLYFDENFYPYHIILHLLFIIFLIRIWLYKENVFKPYLIFMLIPITYALPLFFEPASAYLAIQGVIRASSTVAFFIMAVYVFHKDSLYHRYVPYMMHGIGLILSLHMLLFDLGILTEGHYIMMGRYAGLVEYANTFGVLLAALFFYGLIQFERTQNKWLMTFHLSVLPMYLFMVFKSQSRGVLLLSSLIFIVVIGLSKTKQQLKLLLVSSLALVTALMLYLAIEQVNVFRMIVLVACLSLLFSRAICECLDRLPKEITFNRLVIPLGMVTLIGFSLVNILNEGLLYDILLGWFELDMSKLTQTRTFTERLAFLTDGFYIFGDAPFIGHGARAWALMYQSVRSYDYQSLEVHNGYLDILIETGIIGFSVIMLLIGLILRQVYRSTDTYITLMPVFLIMGHSFMDFNLSFGYVWFFLIIMTANQIDLTVNLITIKRKTE